MEAWEDDAIVLSARPHGEGHVVAAVLARAHGHWRGHVRGGGSSRGRAVWQPGNIVAAGWRARLADQLGHLVGELIVPAAAAAMEDHWALAILASGCAVAEAVLPEHAPHPRAYEGLAALLARIGEGEALLADYVRWEIDLLSELGYGLDLAACAVTGARDGLVFVSPRTGRAVSEAGAGDWRDRLLPLPAFVVGEAPASPSDLAAGLGLSAHFLARDALGAAHRPLPAARLRLAAKLAGG